MRKSKTKPATKAVAISAKTGEYVTKKFAETHPSTTVKMRVPASRKK
jgi:hypothetical protein